jgi:hypothetical protein
MNSHALAAFRHHVTDLWRALRRRSQKDRTTRERMVQLADAFLPRPRILHLSSTESWPAINGGSCAPPKAPKRKKKRNLMPEGRARIAETVKRRWVAQKKAVVK